MTEQEILDMVNGWSLPELTSEEADDPCIILIQCNVCKEMKSLDEFFVVNHPTNKKRRYGRSYDCKECKRKYERTPKTKANRRNAHLKRTYGFGQAMYDAMLAAQGGGCAICKTKEPGGSGGKFHVDHDHVTGKVRGLLCGRCNRAIGLLNDSHHTVLSAAKYITKHVVPSMIE